MISEITAKYDWDNILKEVDSYDFYHTFDYHKFSITEPERAVLLVYRNQDLLIGIPLIIRPIFNTNYFDATSVYGYPGPISKNIPEDFDNSHLQIELDKYFKKHSIIAVFSRLNPYINHQKNILNGIGECVDKSAVVAINLTTDLETQRLGYQRRIKSQINKARRLCDIIKIENNGDITEFTDIYYETMDRVNAKESYYFSKAFFTEFLNSNDFQTDVLLAVTKDTKETIAGAMFVKTNHIVQYHLAGTKTDFLNLNPVKILIDEMRIIASKEKYDYLNLGGGLGSTEDSLLRFKMSFSKDLKTFCIWKYISNETIYRNLTEKHTIKSIDFFPAYRAL
jgi:hypothetical protein